LYECQNQIKDQANEKKLFFCVVLKEFLYQCPVKCPFFVRGPHISMNTIYQNNFEMECPHFLLMTATSSKDEKLFICSLFGEAPCCVFCPLKARVSKEDTNHVKTD